MSAEVPALPIGLDPLIAEAKRRMRRRRLVLALLGLAAVAASVIAGVSAGGAAPGGSPGTGPTAVRRVSAQGIGGVNLGASKSQTVAELSRLFGPPSRRFVSAGCGPAFTEVSWSHLYVEFRQGIFTGFRYVSGSIQPFSSGHPGRRVRPLLATSFGITVGDTLEQLRRTYGKLTPVGTARWQSSDGLVFYDNAKTFPDSAGSRIIEIKSAQACGDW